MKREQFEITLEIIKRLNDNIEEQDVCAHGYVYAKVGNEVILDGGTEWWVSASALYFPHVLNTCDCLLIPISRSLLFDYWGAVFLNILIYLQPNLYWPGLSYKSF